jgi:hypothetical protein
VASGEPSCTNADLFGGVLRRKLGFDGVGATDCGALNDAFMYHRRYVNAADAAAAAVKAGVDSNCGIIFRQALPWAIGNGTLSVAALDASIMRLLTARVRLGLFDEGDPAAGVPLVEIDQVDSKAHRALALRAAHEGVVLLQNGERAALAKLPLVAKKGSVVAMVGPMANAKMNLLSGYHGDPPLLVSPLDAMRAKWGAAGGTVLYSVGCNVSDVDGNGTHPGNGSHPTPPAVVARAIAAAVQTASRADTIVLGLGLCGNKACGPPGEDATCIKIDETEGIDRSSLELPGSQMTLFRKLLALGKPLVVFLMNAGPVDVGEIKKSGVPILAAGYGGEFGGQATADVISGAVNPSGATPLTWYPQRFADLVSFRAMDMRTPPGRTYRFLDEASLPPLWPFAFGLSYTTFSVRFTKRPTVPVAPTGESEWVVRVANTGAVRGAVVVACYVKATLQTAVSAPPRRSLWDFRRVPELDPAEATSLAFTLSARGRALVDETGDVINPPGEYAVHCEAGGVAATETAQLVVKE